ncbi:MAG: ribosome small subunit-dependent GTPase A [Bacilli bacterium]
MRKYWIVLIMEGQIVKIISNLYTVKVKDKFYECSARGKFRNDKISPIVGDIVVVDINDKQIKEIKERRNELKRPIIANVDVALIVTSVRKPDLSLNLLDKLICNITFNKIEPVICFTKLDLLSFKEKMQLRHISKYYEKIGIKVVTNKNLNKLKKVLKDKVVVLTGQTGAGKSSLINKLNKELHLDVGEISEALGRGRHTTRHVELFKLDSFYVADTPGFSSLDFEFIDPLELKSTFIEFNNFKCDFKNCLHDHEKKCAVKNAVENGSILQSRYDNYIKFLGEIK